MSIIQEWRPSRLIDRSSPIPLYYQLQEILKQEIEDGTWAPDEYMPSESELSAVFGVSRPVIRSALDILEGDGQVVRVRGKGTLVAKPKFRYEIIGAAASWTRGKRSNVSIHRVLSTERVPAGGHVGRLLKVPPGDEVFELAFTLSVDGDPASLTHLVVRSDALHDLGHEGTPTLVYDGRDALTQLRDDFGLGLIESQLTIEATPANAFESDLLNIRQNAPVFLISSLEFGEEKHPIAFSRTVVRSDQFQFSTVVRRGGSGSLAQLGLEAAN